MKRILLCLLVLTCFSSFGQISGIKIRTTPPSITEPVTVSDSSSKKKYGLDENDLWYKTIESIEWNYKNGRIEELEKELAATLLDLHKNSKDEVPQYYDEDLKSFEYKRIKVIKDSLAILNQEKDSLYEIYVKDFIQFRKANYLFGPRKSNAFFDLIYQDMGKNFRLLSNTGFTLGEDTGTLFTELVSGNLFAFRVSLGVMVSSSSSEDADLAQQQEAYNKLASYGGNTVLNLEYPLLFLHTKDFKANLITRFLGKGTADFPAFGTTTEDFAGSIWAGFDIYGQAALNNDAMNFFANLNLYGISGTKSFISNLALDNSRFFFGQATVGILFQNVKLSFVLSSISSEEVLRKGNIVIGGQILPTQFN